MSRKSSRSSPPASRRPLVPPKPSLSLKLLASAIALSPCLFQHTAQELLYPLFSTAPTHALETTVPFYSLILATFVIQEVSFKAKPGWRSCWLVTGVWKILSEGLIRWYGEKLLELGLMKGVLAGRLLLEAIPLLAMANWIWGQFECKEVSSVFAPQYGEISLKREESAENGFSFESVHSSRFSLPTLRAYPKLRNLFIRFNSELLCREFLKWSSFFLDADKIILNSFKCKVSS